MKSNNHLPSMKILMIVILGFFLFLPVINAEKVNNAISIDVSCSNSTYANISYIKYKSDSYYIVNSEKQMTKNGNWYNYSIDSSLNNRTEDIEYSYHCDVNGIDVSAGDIIKITSTGLNGTMFLIILSTILAFAFLIISLFGNTEFFLFVSGCLFLVDGMFIMIFGLNDILNFYTRTIAFISIGVGLLLALGSYLDSEGFGTNTSSETGDDYDYYEE